MGHPKKGMSFDDNGNPVEAVGFDYDALEGEAPDAEQPEGDPSAKALDTLRHGLLFVLAGHRDAANVRAAALATLAGLYSSPSEAARAIGVNRSTITRAMSSMREQLRRGLCNAVLAQRPNKTATPKASARSFRNKPSIGI